VTPAGIVQFCDDVMIAVVGDPLPPLGVHAGHIAIGIGCANAAWTGTSNSAARKASERNIT
jgi:hypothetical protein